MAEHTRFQDDETPKHEIQLSTISIDTTPSNAHKLQPSESSVAHYQSRYRETQRSEQTDNDWEDDLRSGNTNKCRDLRERFILVFLNLIGLTCLSLSIYRFTIAERSSGFALLIVGILTLTPGIYYAVKMYRLRGTNISVFDRV